MFNNIAIGPITIHMYGVMIAAGFLAALLIEKEVYIKHFEDSLSGAEFFPEGAKVIEIGSGGGFPSIPLKIARDDLNFTLLEATGKKCEYLKKTGEKLGFKDYEVLNGRAEDC